MRILTLDQLLAKDLQEWLGNLLAMQPQNIVVTDAR
jgi:hypothetical protein